jgi:hypothetical protein
MKQAIGTVFSACICIVAGFSPQLLPSRSSGLAFNGPNYEAQWQVPSLNLTSVPSEDFINLVHPAYPNHAVRIKRSHFCDPTVK